MTKAQIKKELCTLPSKSVVSILMELYDAFPAVKENLDARFAQDKAECNAELLDKYKKIIQDEYFPTKDEEKCRISVCKKAISDFKELKPEAHDVADLMVFFVEQGCLYTSEYGDMWESFYTAFENNYRTALEYVFKNELQDEFKDRLKECLRLTENCGWGFIGRNNRAYDIRRTIGRKPFFARKNKRTGAREHPIEGTICPGFI